MKAEVKRIYEPKAEDDGLRILVDRLWPRGISKKDAGVDLWLKEIAPSNELRRWFGHDPEKWREFQRRYKAELRKQESALGELSEKTKGRKKITFLYAAKDTEHNNAVVLRDFLDKRD